MAFQLTLSVKLLQKQENSDAGILSKKQSAGRTQRFRWQLCKERTDHGLSRDPSSDREGNGKREVGSSQSLVSDRWIGGSLSSRPRHNQNLNMDQRPDWQI